MPAFAELYHLLEQRHTQRLPTLVSFADGAQYDLSTLELMGENDDGELEIGCIFTSQLAPDYRPNYKQRRADGFIYHIRLVSKVLDTTSGTTLYSWPLDPLGSV